MKGWMGLAFIGAGGLWAIFTLVNFGPDRMAPQWWAVSSIVFGALIAVGTGVILSLAESVKKKRVQR